MMAYKLSILCHYKICVFGPRFVERMVHQAIIALEHLPWVPIDGGQMRNGELNSPENLQPPNDLTQTLFFLNEFPEVMQHCSLWKFGDHAMGLIHFYISAMC